MPLSVSRVGIATALAAGGLVPVLAAAPAHAAGCTRDVPDAGEAATFEKPDDAVASLLRLDEAHRISRGDGVGIAVVDSGVDAGTGMVDVRGGGSVTGAGRTLDDAHGTIVAGLAAGDDEERGVVGVAPDAHVVPIRVTAARDDAVSSTDPGPELSGDRLAAGIRQAIDRRKVDNIRVINLSLVLDDVSKPVADAIDDATRAGILVVAAVGNRTADPADEDDPDRYRVGEEKVRFPATHDGVLGVTALDPNGDFDPTFVWTGPGTDVAAPAVGAITVSVGGSTCAVVDIASSWATAQVSGLAALLFAENGKWTPAQVATRIEATARGAYSDNALDGHGMVQPLEALTARLDISRSGELRRTPAYVEERPRLRPPERPADVAADSRRTMLWWGIGAGGAVLLGLLLRPLTARRRG